MHAGIPEPTAARSEGQLRRKTRRETMSNVKAGPPAFSGEIVAVLRKVRIACAGEETGRVIGGFPIRVRRQDGHSSIESLLKLHLQRVVL